MEDKNESAKIDEVMLPGFRFHPTDEELVGFYLRRKIQQRPLHIELIKQVDIYKYDPWDLPSKKFYVYVTHTLSGSFCSILTYTIPITTRSGIYWGERELFLLSKGPKVQE